MSKLSDRDRDRAILRLFNVDTPVIPRMAMTCGLYDYAYTLWSNSPRGRREIEKQKYGKRRTRKP